MKNLITGKMLRLGTLFVLSLIAVGCTSDTHPDQPLASFKEPVERLKNFHIFEVGQPIKDQERIESEIKEVFGAQSKCFFGEEAFSSYINKWLQNQPQGIRGPMGDSMLIVFGGKFWMPLSEDTMMSIYHFWVHGGSLIFARPEWKSAEIDSLMSMPPNPLEYILNTKSLLTDRFYANVRIDADAKIFDYITENDRGIIYTSDIIGIGRKSVIILYGSDGILLDKRELKVDWLKLKKILNYALSSYDDINTMIELLRKVDPSQRPPEEG